ncbi:hypothetical protein BLOT_016821 [Blomia tropicalis]|nr:hypothetical protein BLOT_016821 [Blomia tropicalis]
MEDEKEDNRKHVGYGSSKLTTERIGGYWVNGTYNGILRLLWEEKLISFHIHLQSQKIDLSY